MIRYLGHTIHDAQHVETKETWWELSYWYTSDKSPQVAGRRHSGYFKSREEAEKKHNQNLVNGLLKDEE